MVHPRVVGDNFDECDSVAWYLFDLAVSGGDGLVRYLPPPSVSLSLSSRLRPVC